MLAEIKSSKRLRWSFLIPFLLLISCKVMLIGAYDQVTDQSIQKIQNDVSTILVKIEGYLDAGNTDANKYDNFKDKYDEVNGQILSLSVRCGALPKYKVVLDQVTALKNSISDLQKYHKLGFSSKSELAPIESALKIQFQTMTTLQNALKRQKASGKNNS